mgnify:CR=1 FL=1
MQSIRSRLIIFLLKHRNLFVKKAERINWIDENTSIEKLRNMVEKGAGSFGKLPKGIILEKLNIDGLYAEWLTVKEKTKKGVILYLHGGGLVVGSAPSHRGIVSKFVKGSGVPALVPDYGLAPEKPFPSGLNDCLKAYEYLLKQGFSEKNIIIAGDSGGGNLVFSMLLTLKENNRKLPAAAFALSPWTDLTNSGESWKTNEKVDHLTWRNSQNVFSSYYCNGKDPKNFLISPLYGDLSGLCPIRLYAGSNELMLSDSIRFAEKCRNAGGDIKLTIGKGLFHCYPAIAPLFPEATKAMKEICLFIQKMTGNDNDEA